MIQPSSLERWQARYEKFRALPARDILSVFRDKGADRLERVLFRAQSIFPGYPPESALRRSLTLAEPFDRFIDRSFPSFDHFFLTEEEKERLPRLFAEEFPGEIEAIRSDAEQVVSHRFRIMGTEVEAGPRIDWQRDYTADYTWPFVFSRKVQKIDFGRQTDIKYPWELSRFHQGVLLGRAFVLTGDQRYAREFFAQFKDWMVENPPGYGVNWICTMEVAIRSVNLIWSFFLCKNSPLLDRDLKILFLQCMLAHGRYIFRNLEYSRVFTGAGYRPLNGNHYIADLLGLLYIGLAFPQFREAAVWLRKAREELINEIRLQVLDDGVHHELSPNYHRLVLEMFLSGLLLLEKNGLTAPPDVLSRVEKMFDFTLSYTRPDGSMPLVRDIDNGRFHILGHEALTDHTHLLPLGALLFDRSHLASSGFCQDALWLLGPGSAETFRNIEGKNREEQKSRAFTEGGFYVLRKEKLFMFALCASIGLEGQNGHAHNDFLSFDLFAFDKTFFTDCGSFVYSRQPDWRNRFRSTASHNTAVIDGLEINPFSNGELFTLRERSRLHVDRWESSSLSDLLEAHYRVGEEGRGGVTHRRRFLFDKEGGYWIIRDDFEADDQKRHRVDVRFHFAKGIKVAVEKMLALRTVCPGGANLILLLLSHPPNLAMTLETGWVSGVYGQKHKIQVGRYIYSGELPVSLTFLLYPVPHSEEQAVRLPRILSYDDYCLVSAKEQEIKKKVEAMSL